MSTFEPEDNPRIVTAVLLALSLTLLALFHLGCAHPKPTAVDPNAPIVWQLPKAAGDGDPFCLEGIDNPPVCRKVWEVRRYLASVQAQP